MSYPTTSNRLQITTLDGRFPAPKFHEDVGDGSPICKILLRTYKGLALRFTDRGSGEVTCGKCERVTSG